jgi:signal transduction histidine kinase
MSRFAAYAALCRALLLGRLVITVAAVALGLGLGGDGWRRAGTLAGIAVVTVAEVGILSRWPAVVRWRLPVLALDTVLMVGVLIGSQGGVAYFCYAAGHAALAGALLGSRGLPIWLADALLGLSVAVVLLRADATAAATTTLAQFVLAFPMIDLVCGLGAAVTTTALARYIKVSVQVVTTAQRTAAASERARLARELHDSVTKTLRGVSFAAVALPSLLRQKPDLAEQLATAVSEGADAAVQETRDLLAGLRRDEPDHPFADNVRRICQTWSASTGVKVKLSLARVEPPLAARYELAQITSEALHNVAKHAKATLVEVGFARRNTAVELVIRDNGSGFDVPAEPTDLSTTGHFGILGMTERATAAGGTLRLRSSPGAGTTVAVTVPMSRW